MNRSRILFIATLALGALPAIAQHGHGGAAGGAVGMHGAPPVFTSSAGGSTKASTTNANNPGLAARTQALLPAGTTVQAAAAGFRNTGQFLAAVHVAHNLNLSFTQLKAAMTGSSPESLGQAIHALDPNLARNQIHTAVRTAERQTSADLATANLVQQITANARLARQVQRLLPAGTTITAAAAGFRNEGQFLAALHVSNNLGIPFAQLRAKVTGPNAESLGRAIQDLRPGLSRDTVEADIATAREQAKLDRQTS
jgi:hypothetical protein